MDMPRMPFWKFRNHIADRAPCQQAPWLQLLSSHRFLLNYLRYVWQLGGGGGGGSGAIHLPFGEMHQNQQSLIMTLSFRCVLLLTFVVRQCLTFCHCLCGKYTRPTAMWISVCSRLSSCQLTSQVLRVENEIWRASGPGCRHTSPEIGPLRFQ